MTSSRHFLRRKDARRRVSCGAFVECRGISQRIHVVDFSTSGLRLDGVIGLTTGDRVSVTFAPDLKVEGRIAWSVWHKAGVELLLALSETDPLYIFLSELAAEIERDRMRSIAALARQRTTHDPQGEAP